MSTSAIAKMLAAAPEGAPAESPVKSLHELEPVEGEVNVDDEGQEAAVEEILHAFHANDPQGLREALKSFIEMCR